MKRKFLQIILFSVAFVAMIFYGCIKDDDEQNNNENPNPNTETFTDSRDGKTYSFIKIGDQTWMTENLAYKTSQGCWAYNNDESNVNEYGYLYDWETAMTACPDGWHLPSDSEWQELINYLGGEQVAGGKMKEEGTSHWGEPNAGATNSSGFTGLPGGNYSSYGFQSLHGHGYFWSSYQPNSSSAKSYTLYFDQVLIGYGISPTSEVGSSLRCIKSDQLKSY